MGNTDKLIIDGNSLTLQDVYRVAYNPAIRIEIAKSALENMKKSRQWVDGIARDGYPVVYGINTGFGSKASVTIDKEHLKDLQRNLIKSHSAGTGEFLPIPVIRGAMLLRANTLCKGYSGIRVEVVQLLLEMLHRNVIPALPTQGSVGASGDLAPLSHMALVLSKSPDRDEPDAETGMAYWYDPDAAEFKLLSGREAMNKADLPQVVLEAKEGLALNNGTQVSTSIAALTLYQARQLLNYSDISMAMSLEALLGNSSPFHPHISMVRPHPGHQETARRIRQIIEGSTLIDSHPGKVQDAYSLRCYPQVAGAVRDTLDFAESMITREINSSNDNPLIFPDLSAENKTLSGGNFHGEPVAFVMDFMAIALSELASISERRTFRLITNYLNYGLPSFLIKNSGLESGLMIAQYTAASIVSENKSLAHPASVDSIPTCEDQEDHVSMSPIAARKAMTILTNSWRVIAIELLASTQAIRLRLEKDESYKPGKGTNQIYNYLAQRIPPLQADRVIHNDIERVLSMMESSELIELSQSLFK